jgi:hypothetical protein
MPDWKSIRHGDLYASQQHSAAKATVGVRYWAGREAAMIDPCPSSSTRLGKNAHDKPSHAYCLFLQRQL